MAACPAGHESATTDYCDVCGLALDKVSSPVAPKLPPARPCPGCATPRTGRFCEACGHDFASPQPAPTPTPTMIAERVDPGRAGATSAGTSGDHGQLAASAVPPVRGEAAGAWVAVVAADPEYYRSVVAVGGPDIGSVRLPVYVPERRFTLTGAQLRIGRRSASRGIDPEIDLSGPPEDPGVSHLHAVLLARPDGGWAILDPGSTNGTTLDDDPTPLAPNTPVALADGTRIHLGAWTTITLHAPHPPPGVSAAPGT